LKEITKQQLNLKYPKYAHERWISPRHFGGAAPKITNILSNLKMIIHCWTIQAIHSFENEA
jgi:hypothetical protein